MALRNTLDHPSRFMVAINLISHHLKLQRHHTRLQIKAITAITTTAIRATLEANKREWSYNHPRTRISLNEAVMPCMNLRLALLR